MDPVANFGEIITNYSNFYFNSASCHFSLPNAIQLTIDNKTFCFLNVRISGTLIVSPVSLLPGLMCF